MSEIDNLVLRRPKRSTAGNRMEAALAEIALEETTLELDDDQDFVGLDDEEEVFDSDFQSTDEDGTQDGSGEMEIVQEEKQARKSARQRAVRAVETFVTRRRGNNQTSTPSVSHLDATPRMSLAQRRVSLGAAIDVETGEILARESKRKSRRRSTILSSQILHSRLRDAEQRKAAMPKKTKEATHLYSQAELIAHALDLEEGNILDHRNFISQEEERRKRVKVVRKTISGPVLRRVSKIEDEKAPSQQPVNPWALPGRHSINEANSTSRVFANPDRTHVLTSQTLTTLVLREIPATDPTSILPLQATHERAKVSKNYLIHELGQYEGVANPLWEDTMSAAFGDHVKWDEVKVYSGKLRPLSRPVPKCPITGKPAIYCDPRSGVPFANVGAFKTLTEILAHEYVWNEELNCYTADAKEEDASFT